MKKKGLYLIIIIIMIILTSGCNSTKSHSLSAKRVYVCKNTEKTNGLKSLTSFAIELNEAQEPVQYTIINGYGNYGENLADYNKFCEGLKEALKKQPETYKEMAQVKVTCDEEKLEAYVTKTYDVLKIQNIEYFETITNHLSKYQNEDGTFNLEAWKDYYYTDSIYAGKFTCDF